MRAQENKPRAVHCHAETLSLSSGGGRRQRGAGRLGDCVNVFIKLSFMLTEITQQQQTPEQPSPPLPTPDKNQIITGVTYALSAWYFNLAFQLIHTMIKASIICSLWRPVEQEQQRLCSLIRVVHSVQMKLLIFITADLFS